MTREEVIRGLECCTQHGSMSGRNCNGHWGWTDGSHTGMELLGEYRTKCPYGNCETGCVKTLTKDALALLKAQEPVAPVLQSGGNYVCGNCGMYTVGYMHPLTGESVQTWQYCGHCGKAVRWE